MESLQYFDESDMKAVTKPSPSSRFSFPTRRPCPLLSAFSKFLSRLRTSTNPTQKQTPSLAQLLASRTPLLQRHDTVIRVSDLVQLFVLLLLIHMAPDRELSLQHLVQALLCAIKTTLVVSMWLNRVPSRLAGDCQDSESSSSSSRSRTTASPEFRNEEEAMLKVEHQPRFVIRKCPAPAHGDFKTHGARTQENDVGMSSDVAVYPLTVGVKFSKSLECQLSNDLSVQTPCILSLCPDLHTPLAANYMPAGVVQGMTSEDVQGMNAEDVQGMNAEDVQGMTSEDVQGMTSEDVQGMPANDLEETPTSEMTINQQEQPPDHKEGRTSSDEPQNSTDFQISRIVTTFKESLERVKPRKPKQWKKTWRSLAKNSLLPYFPHKKNSDRKQKKFQKMEHALTTFEELARKGTVKDAVRKQWMSMRFSPRNDQQVYLCEGPKNGRHNDMRMEECRLASFSECAAVPPSGVWVTRLAAAGFFCPDRRGSVLRCAFCGVEEEINSFRHQTPMEVHRSLSPSCPMVKGDAPNRSIQEHRHKMGLQYTAAFFAPRADKAHQETKPPSSDSKDRKELQGPVNGAASPQLMSSGQLPEPSSQPNPATSSSHESRREGHHRQSSGSPPHPHPHPSSASANASGGAAAHPAVLPSTPSLPTPPGGAGRQSATHPTLPPPLPQTQTPPQTSGQAPAQHTTQTQQGPPQTSQRVPGQPESHSQRSGGGETTPYQTARHIETDAERSEPSPHPNTDAAATSGEASSAQSPSPSSNESVRQLVTYAQLGIYTQEPKRPELAIAGARISSFSNWPHCATHPPEDMAEAGFYFVGVDDLVRCFYCKGGLKSWSRSLRPWVEHARFYPKCPFVGQVKGPEFIEVVQELNSRLQGEISNAQVDQELQKRQLTEPEQGAPSSGQQAASEGGKAKKQTLLVDEAAAAAAAGRGSPGDKGRLYPLALEAGTHGDIPQDDAQLEKVADKLENENVEIKNERICKICQVEDVSILFLPCGHLVSCSQCAPALRTCAVCRQKVKGRVRVLADKATVWPKEGDDWGDPLPSKSTMSGQ